MKDGVCAPMFRNRLTDGVASEIVLDGGGSCILDGGLPNGLDEFTSRKEGRPHVSENLTLFFTQLDGFEIKDLTVRDQRWWALMFLQCTKGRIGGIRFELTRHVLDSRARWRNQDGIDLRVGCHDIVIEDITGETGDDLIALTALNAPPFEGKYARADRPRDISNITIRRVKGRTNQCALIRLLSHFGQPIHHVAISDVVEDSVPGVHNQTQMAIRIGDRFPDYYRKDEAKNAQRFGDISDVTIDGLVTRALTAVHTDDGIRNLAVRNVRLFGDAGSVWTAGAFGIDVSPFIYLPEREDEVRGSTLMPDRAHEWGFPPRTDRVRCENVIFDGVTVESTPHRGEAAFRFRKVDFRDCAIRNVRLPAGRAKVETIDTEEFPPVGVARPLAAFVDPFVGTAGMGHTTPAAAYPFGFLQPGPDTGWNDWEHCSGYQHGDTELLGFSQTHLSGTGCPDLGDMRFVPMTGAFRRDAYALKMDKTSERASVGYYAVRLPDEGLFVEATVAPKAAMYRITPEEDATVHLLFDQEARIGDFAGFRHVTMPEGFIRNDGDRAFDAYFRRHGWVTERTVYSRFEFSHPFAVAAEFPCVDRKNGVVRRVYDFKLKKGEPLVVRLAFSTALNSAAKANLDRDLGGRSFDEVRANTEAAWEDVLARVKAEGTPEQLKSFYTAVYHLFFQPNEISDYGEKPFYSTLSCWDTFRASHPLYTIFCPEKIPDYVASILEQGRRTGFLPIWTLWGIDNQCMIGVHSIPVLVDAYLKGFSGDWQEAWRQIVSTQTVRHPARYKEDWKVYDAFGYFPYDLVPLEGVSRTFEVCFDDYCAAVLGRALGKPEASFFSKRAQNWKNLWRDDIGFPCGRDAKGCWRPDYDPARLGHEVETKDRGCDFTEGNGWQYMWHVMQDPEGLVERLGGKEAFAKKLDGLFKAEVDPAAKKISDVTGLIGQYAHGNEPSHHVAYFYQYAGRPDRTAEVVREVFDRFYGIAPDGLCGNDDCGQMSAWYVFSAMGFYPFNPCGGDYVLGAPQLEKVVLTCSPSPSAFTSFTIVAKNLSKENKYVKSVTLNGKKLDGFVIRHEQVVAGGELVFEMWNGRP